MDIANIRKCMDGNPDCSDEGSVRTEQAEVEIVATDDAPWYLRGPKSVYITYYAISEADLSSESEIDDENPDDEKEESSDEDIDDEEDEEEGQLVEAQTEGGTDGVPPEESSDMASPSEEQPAAESETDLPEKKEDASEMDIKDLGKEESETHRGESTTQGDYWQIRKLMKYIRGGNEATTVVATSIVCEHDLTLEGHKNAIVDTGGLEIFLNLLTVENLKCVQGTLKVLKQMVIMPDVSTELVELGIMEDLIGLMKHSEEDVLSDVVCITADLAESQIKVRTISRKIGILPYLVDMVDKIPRNILLDSINNLNGSPMVRMEIALDAMRALAALARSRGVRMVLYRCGILHLLPYLLFSKEDDLKSNALLIIMYCASIPIYRNSFEAHHILKPVISCWKEPTKDEVILRIIYKISLTISRRQLTIEENFAVISRFESGEKAKDLASEFNMATSEEGRNQLLKCRVLKKIITLIRDEKIFSRFNVLKYCLASIYRLGIDPKVRDQLQELELIPFLVRTLCHEDEGLVVYSSGVLSYMSPKQDNWKKIKEAGCASVLIKIIEGKMDPALLANVDLVIGDLCNDPNLLAEFCAKDAIKHIWSHLSYDSVELQKAASRALVPLLNVDDSGEEVRNLSGSMDLLIDLLDSKDDMVKASSCAALAKVSRDPENLNILMEMNIVQKINDLITKTNSYLKQSLCQLIAGVAEHPKGCYEIGRSRAIEHLVEFLIRRFSRLNNDVKASAARALWKLSQEPVNAANLYNAGVVPLLLDCLQEGHPKVKEPAEGCLFNIRSLAHDAEEISFFGSLKPGKSLLGGKRRAVEYVPKFFKEPNVDDDL